MTMIRKGTTRNHYNDGRIEKGYSYDLLITEGCGVNVEAVLWPNEIVLYPKTHNESKVNDFEININSKGYHFEPEKISKFFRWAMNQPDMNKEFKRELREVLTKVKREYVRKFGEIF
ncbi:MAG: hypothetical protein J6U54_00415 [Clostridiales bacterium]|nr:hypothetical protein [Clostridiales bacterium]